MKHALMSATASFAHLLGREKPAVAAPAPGATNDKQREGESDEHFQRRYDRDNARGESDDLQQGDDESDEDFKKRKAAADDDKKKDDENDDEHKARVAANVAARAAVAPPKVATPPQAQTLPIVAQPAPPAPVLAVVPPPPPPVPAASVDDATGNATDAEDMRMAATMDIRLRERARCEAIFADEAAGKNPALAATLAFKTGLPRTEAITVLRAGGLAVAETPRGSLDRRMAMVAVPVVMPSDPARPTGNAQPDGYEMATRIMVASMRRDGETPEKIQAFITGRNQG